MKTKVLFTAVTILTVLFFGSCEKEQFETQSSFNNDLALKSEASAGLTDPIFTSDPTSLSDDEIAGILLMREEEKMAHDVYVNFYNEFGVRVFTQIANSEATHTNTIGDLIRYFNLSDPMLEDAGAFSNSEIQTLYGQLIEMGSASVEDALKTGAFIEEYDIIDLQKLIAETTNPDLLLVYGNLLAGSENHLRAFVRNLANLGITYEVQLMDTEAFEAVLAAQNGNRGGGNAVDADGDGYCDTTGEAIGAGTGNSQRKGNKGGNGVGIDADGDGLCDVTGEPVGIGSQANKGNKGGNGNSGNGK